MITSSRWNRIINLRLYTLAGGYKEIKCPQYGRKPNIEIHGVFADDGFIPSFNIKVSNLYLDLQSNQYTKITVEAGYVNNTAVMTGTILTIYQEQPGPEGATIIQCQSGELQNWLDATVQLNFTLGTPLLTVLQAIRAAIGAARVAAGIKASAIFLKTPFYHDGTAREALDKLKGMFDEEQIVFFLSEGILHAERAGTGDFAGIKTLQYLSAPPQQNSGDAAGAYYTTLTAPWLPNLRLFDKLRIPSYTYQKNFGRVGFGGGGMQTIQVTSLSFDFATTGRLNTMTVQGVNTGY